MDSSRLNILIYVFIWFVTFLVAFFKFSSRKLGASTYLFFVVFFCSVCSYYTFIDPWNPEDYKEITLFPFIYLYLMVIITSLPAIRFDRSLITSIQKPSQGLLDFIAWSYIICTILTIPSEMQDFGSNVIATMAGAGADLYIDKTSGYDTAGTGISNFPSIIGGFFYFPSIVIAFYYLTLDNNKRKKVMLFLFLSFTYRLVYNIFSGQRGGMVREFFFLASYYAMFYRFYSDRIKKIVNRVVVIIGIALLVPFMLLTISRFDDALGGPTTSMLCYTGQSSLFFNNYGLDDNGIRYGDRVAAGFKILLGFDNVPKNFVQRRQKYPRLYINDESFYTYVGDFTIDFGPIVGGLIMILFSLYFTSRLKIYRREIKFYQLMILGTIVGIISQGYLKLFPFSGLTGNLSLIFIFGLCIVFKQDYVKQLKRKKNTYENLSHNI